MSLRCFPGARKRVIQIGVLTATISEIAAELDDMIVEEAPHLGAEERQRVSEIIIETLQFRYGPELEAVDELEAVITNPSYPEQKIQIGKQLSAEERVEIVELLKESSDVFAWRVEDMNGIKEEVAVHRLEVNPTMKHKAHKLRSFARDKEEAIKLEVQKLLSAGIIKETSHTTCLVNVVMVKKSNGKWRSRLHQPKSSLPQG